MMISRTEQIGIVGAGPATVYLLSHLDALNIRFSATIFECHSEAGRGLPYCQANSAFSLLSNLSPDEVPPTVISFRQWCAVNRIPLKNEPVPRYLIGQFLHWSLHYFINKSSSLMLLDGCCIERVVSNVSGGFTVFADGGKPFECKNVVINTGHGISHKQSAIQYVYPLSGLKLSEEKQQIHLVGSSMAAIDCALYIAQLYGAFYYAGNKIKYQPRKPVTITMFSESGKFPLPYFPSRDFRSEIQEFVERINREQSYLATINVLYERVLLPLMEKHTPHFYQQCYRKSMPEFFSYWQNSFRYKEADKTLKLSFFLVDKCPEFPLFLAILEAFFDSLHELNITLSPKDEVFITQTCIPFLAKNNGAVPETSAGKILALMDAGILNVKPGKKFSADLPAHISDNDVTTIDCRGACTADPYPLIRRMAKTGLITLAQRNASRSYLRVMTDRQYRAYASLEHGTAIYVGAVPLLHITSNTLPGMAVTANVARHIASSLSDDIKVERLENVNMVV